MAGIRKIREWHGEEDDGMHAGMDGENGWQGSHGGGNPESGHPGDRRTGTKRRRARRLKKFPEILDKAGFDLYNCIRSAAH